MKQVEFEQDKDNLENVEFAFKILSNEELKHVFDHYWKEKNKTETKDSFLGMALFYKNLFLKLPKNIINSFLSTFSVSIKMNRLQWFIGQFWVLVVSVLILLIISLNYELYSLDTPGFIVMSLIFGFLGILLFQKRLRYLEISEWLSFIIVIPYMLLLTITISSILTLFPSYKIAEEYFQNQYNIPFLNGWVMLIRDASPPVDVFPPVLQLLSMISFLIYVISYTLFGFLPKSKK